MGWSGRAPAPPASYSGKGHQRQGAHYVSETQHRNRRDRHRYREELVPHRRPGSARSAGAGGVTSIATSWLGQQRQTKEQRRAQQKVELQDLYRQFIHDASKLYIDALEHNTTEIAKLVDIYATINRMRVLSSRNVIVAADNALRMIIDTYAKENTTFSGIRQSIGQGFSDPLRAFGQACHEELKMY
jgi:hypothetical protein